MKWNYLGLAALLQLGLSGLASATFDGSGIGSLEDLLAVRAEEAAAVGLSAPLERRQAGGRCGPDGGGAICAGNLCCSAFGYCGDGDSYCPQIVGCQGAFGWCEGEPLPSPTSSATPTSTSTTTSRPTSTSTTSSSTTTPPVTTTSSTSVSSSPTATSTSPAGPLQISQNGMCGNGTTCAGSRFGRCCSQFYYCGNEDSFCGSGCQSQFGSCGVAGGVSTVTVTSIITSSITVSVGGGGVPITATTTITQTVTSIISSVVTTTVGTTIVPTSSTTPTVTSTPTTTTSRTTTSSVSTPSVSIPAGMRSSTDGTCGNGVTCLGSAGGQCCSQWGYCGDDRQFCVTLLGCQPEFGRCSSS
ncbi:hypothetical protein GE09DRAFT_491478 [Coniochaeta sp. 2T2.1]|nr:hypothetical protein GE09DRAFT_491478 [Coniochaeta sp. 2T2.1]